MRQPSSLSVAALFGLIAAATAGPTQATREGRAAFDLTIAGIPIGDASLRVALREDRYVIDADADFGFLFWGGTGAARAEGGVVDGALRPSRYSLAYEGVTRPGRVDIEFDGARAVRWDREPPIPERFAEGRLPVTDAHLAGVLDPLSALVIPAPADVAPQALCRRVLPVFSGYTRFDLRLISARGVEDGAVACETRYAAVAGHREDSRGVRRMRRPDALRIALAPIAPGAWGPHRVAVSTRFGTLEVTRR